MTLEDFFTLTEMKNGLSILARVEELISVMERQKDCVMNNAGDTARQWSTVASTLAATENMDCLKHFIDLNGLFFLNQWLQEALKCSNDVSSSTMEEVINSLLESLERLPLDKEKSTASGIWVTAEQLLDQKNSSIKERVRNLLDKWNNRRVGNVSSQDMENGGTWQDNQCKPSADANTVEVVHSLHPVDISSHNTMPQEGTCRVDLAGTESHHSNSAKCSDSSELDSNSDVKISTSNQTLPIEFPTSTNANANEEEINSLGSSHVSNCCQENFAITEESSVPVVEMASARSCISAGGRGEDAEKESEASELNVVNSAKEMKVEVEVNITEGDPCKAGQKETCIASPSSGGSVSLSAQKMESTVSYNFDSRESKSCISKNAEPQPTNWGADCGLPKHLISTTEELNCVAYVAKGSQDLPSSVCNVGKIDGRENCVRMEDVESDSSVKEHCSEGKLKVSEGLNLVIPSSSSKTVSMEVMSEMDRRSGMEVECVEIDALEVAQQVVLEVEREVVDYREPSCNSSPDNDSGGIVEIGSPDLVEGKQDQPVMEELNGNESPSGKDLSHSASSPKDGIPRIPAPCGTDTERQEHVFKTELTPVAQETDSKIDKNVWDFNLNEDACCEDGHSISAMHDTQVNLSAPKAIAAASKGAPELPVSSLCFENELGWKGSAARSAFCPASPRKPPDAGKTYLGAGNKANILEIDLNAAAESEDNAASDQASVKQIPQYLGFPSGESSIQDSSRRAERPKLDLNRPPGDEDTPPDLPSFWKPHHQNGDRCPSTASSSSSRHPSMRDIDLNEPPSLFDIGGPRNPNKSSCKAPGVSGISKLDDPAVTILLGWRMAVERKDCGNQTWQSYLGNGPSSGRAVFAQQALPDAPMRPPAYGYHGPYPSAPYGTEGIPYMVDSGGAAVLPRMLLGSGSGSAGLSGARSAMPPTPFLASVAGAPVSLKGVGSSPSGLDLNSGMTFMGSGNREREGFRHFMQERPGLMEEQTRTASQLASSQMSRKRREPDSGWEPWTLRYKRGTFWQ